MGSDDKPDPDEVAREVAGSLVGLKPAVDVDGFLKAATPDYRVEGLAELLRYRLLATGSWPGHDAGPEWPDAATAPPETRTRADAPSLPAAAEPGRGRRATETDDGTAVGVLDFLAVLPARLRTLSPATDGERRVRQGRADGAVDWPATRRYRRRSGGSQTAFVTRATSADALSERTRVLVWLLTRLREAADGALAMYRQGGGGGGDSDGGDGDDGSDGDGDGDEDTAVPPWLEIWDEPEPGSAGGEGVDGPRGVLAAALADNPHLDGVAAGDVTVTDREVDAVARDRDPLYAEAGALARELRRLDGGLADATKDDLADLFQIEAFEPDATESHEGSTVFELYWALELLDTVPSDSLSRFDTGGDQVLSRWEEGDSEFLLCHDTDGTVELAGEDQELVTFVATHLWDDTPLAEPATRRGYLREHYVDLATESALVRDYGKKEPDLLVFEFDAEADDRVLRRLFVGEVKYSTGLSTVRSGLRELVDYAAFARVGADVRLPDGAAEDRDGPRPVGDADFLGDRIELGLFVGDEDRVERGERDDFQTRGWGETPERPLTTSSEPGE